MSASARTIPAATRTRGLQRSWDPRVWGTIIGAVGATVFVMANRSGLPGPWPVIALGVWAAALLGYVLCVFVLPRSFGAAGPVGARSGFIYLASVVGMLLLIRLGTILLENAGRDELRPSLIVLAVGLHFLPFARAFHTPMFTLLGAIMAVLAVCGLALGWTWHASASAAAAVLSGVVMLVVIAGDALRASSFTRSPRSPSTGS